MHWEIRNGREPRLHHIAHGTLGIVHALAAVGRATGRADLVELARAGAADVVARDEAGREGFLVPHSDPQDRPELEHRANPSTLEPLTGWAMGNAGIARELLRFVRVSRGEDPAYAFTWPDHPPATPLVR
ncbi:MULTISPECIES: lanthionine synthetase LanC family protein [unclassified Streptomyces]|uniref:lanthionine synthetase LanC family protein n=1 Tax=unclassified Streptomyces TaxID=2593676 RepID=UPI002E804AAD|nr:lanthionine synthetase LanC family protein [Streptomyces sp. NBC_00589]WTI39485.1 hypothetical protein OIC96_33215 [Streptomyces sp. NBC_00775]WUB26836.1 hypothetical protein OHA51_16515 [Streptomyces sp. NBC_00589]